MIDPVTMRKVWNLEVNDKVLYDNLRIVKTWSILGPKKLGQRALNRIIYGETNKEIPKAWKVRPEKLLTERFVNKESMKTWKTRLKCKKDK